MPIAERQSSGRHEIAALILRIFTAFVLVYGTADNVFSAARMEEFRAFLQANGFPSPRVCAYLSAYAQFICGLLLGVGLFTRYAAALMVFNFIVAVAMVHRNLPFGSNIAPLAMLVQSTFFVIAGAGRFSVDEGTRRQRSAAP